MSEYDLARDPVLAPGLIKLLHDNLNEVRRALESSQRENEALQAKLNRYQDGGEDKGSVDENTRLRETQYTLEGAKETIRRLRVDNNKLQALTEGCYDSAELSQRRGDNMDGGCNSSCQAIDTILQLERQLSDLRTELSDYMHRCQRLHTERDELQERLEDCEVALREERKTSDELRKELKVSKVDFEQKAEKSKAEYDLVNSKYQKYKTQFEGCYQTLQIKKQELAKAQAQAHQSKDPRHCPTPLLLDNAARPELPLSPVSNPRTTPIESGSPLILPKPELRCPEPAMKQEEHIVSLVPKQRWYEVVSHALTNPCFPLDIPNAPDRLPSHVIGKIIPPSSVLNCPDRVIFPHLEGTARVVAAQAQCTTTTMPLHFAPPRYELERLVGSTRELFYHSPSGICYAGTFVCARVGVLTPDEFARLAPQVKNAVMVSSFPSRAEYLAASSHARDRLHQMYAQGAAKVAVLELRFQEYNRPFFDALVGMRVMDGDAPEKRRIGTSPDPPAKRPRGMH